MGAELAPSRGFTRPKKPGVPRVKKYKAKYLEETGCHPA